MSEPSEQCPPSNFFAELSDADMAHLRNMVGDAWADAERIEASGWEVIKATPDCWNGRHGAHWSVGNMSDDELRQSVIEDLLSVHHYETEGKGPSFHPNDLKRFLPENMHVRVDAALVDPHVVSLLTRLSDGQVRIHPHHLQDAMDYCGVWLEGYVPLTDAAVYYLNPDAITRN